MSDAPILNPLGHGHLLGSRQRRSVEPIAADKVFTPDWLVSIMLETAPIAGKVLDPCAGNGAFYNRIPGAFKCEIDDGIDFFSWNQPVDWIIGNPPYSIFTRFFRHSMQVSENIYFVLPLNKIWHGDGFVRDCMEWGWLKQIGILGSGYKCGFPFGFPVATFWFKKGWSGKTTWLNFRNKIPGKGTRK